MDHFVLIQLQLCWYNLLISSLGGLILDRTVTDPLLEGVVLYTPVINGGSNTTHLLCSDQL